MDPYRFVPFATRKVMQAWADREEPPDEVVWTLLGRPLSQCRVALVSTAGIARHDDEPFDQQGERDNPWWGDPSFRTIPHDSTDADVAIHHLHIDTGPAQEDLDVVLPMRRLDELVATGVVGAAAPRHYSIMGYILDATELVTDTAPRLATALADDDVDLAVLIPV